MSDEDDAPKRTPVSTLPVTWSDGAMTGPGQKLPGKSLVVLPNEREAQVFASQQIKTCGSCRFYRHAITQREFEKTKGSWFKELVHEMGWKLRHLGASPRELARCGQKDNVLVGPQSRACEWHRS